MGFNSLFFTRFVAADADGIPLDRYGDEAATAVLTMFALWGLGQLLLGLQGFVVLARYRGLVPLMYLILVTEHLGRKLVFAAHPISRAAGGQPISAQILNWGLLAVLVAGLILSLIRRRSRRD
jgi:hypothetical protein